MYEHNITKSQLIDWIMLQSPCRPLNMMNSIVGKHYPSCASCVLVDYAVSLDDNVHVVSAGFCTVTVEYLDATTTTFDLVTDTWPVQNVDITSIIPSHLWMKIRSYGDLQDHLRKNTSA